MNKRIFLNVMIVAMLTFYMIFNIVYKRLVDKHEPDPQLEVVDIWQGSFMVPQAWQLTRLELPSTTIQIDDLGKWLSVNNKINPETVSKIADSWQNLAANQVTEYQQLPLDGNTILAFVAEDSQPLVYRLIKREDKMHFYRMIDKKLFIFNISSKVQLLAE